MHAIWRTSGWLSNGFKQFNMFHTENAHLLQLSAHFVKEHTCGGWGTPGRLLTQRPKGCSWQGSYGPGACIQMYGAQGTPGRLSTQNPIAALGKTGCSLTSPDGTLHEKASFYRIFHRLSENTYNGVVDSVAQKPVHIMRCVRLLRIQPRRSDFTDLAYVGSMESHRAAGNC